MAQLLIIALGFLMVATAFLSGLFGMAGGLILIGVLLALMPLPTAMVLHAITQMASNGWRAFLWRAHIRWRPVSVSTTSIGCPRSSGRRRRHRPVTRTVRLRPPSATHSTASMPSEEGRSVIRAHGTAAPNGGGYNSGAAVGGGRAAATAPGAARRR